MFYKKLVLAITFIGIIFIGASVAQAAYIAPPSTVGEAVVLIDADTKEILFAKNPDKWMHPASTTKMVTLLTALELKGTQLDELATISSYATSMEESNLGVRVGDQITLEGVLEGMMVASGNDAAVVVAENVSGSVDKFAKDMTRIAAKAGAKNSVFLNPHGLTQKGRSFVTPCRVSYNPKRQASWFGLIPFRSPLLRESHLLSLPPGT